MKKIWKTLVMCLCLLLTGVMMWTGSVSAEETQEAYEPDRVGSIRVCLDDIKTNRSNVSLACYKVGSTDVFEGHLNGFTVNEEYAGLDLNFNELGNIDVHRSAADKLAAYLKENTGISASAAGKTDSEGVCLFSNLEQGVYLIVQNDGFNTYGTMEIFLMTVPYVEDSLYVYDIKTETKGEVPPEITTTPKPSKTPGLTKTPIPSKPTGDVKTGDNTQVKVFAGILAAAVIILIALLVNKNRRRSDEN